jgi:hypothetical protein
VGNVSGGSPSSHPAVRSNRLDSPDFVQVDDHVELLREQSLEIVADSLGLRVIDHPDALLQPDLV